VNKPLGKTGLHTATQLVVERKANLRCTQPQQI